MSGVDLARSGFVKGKDKSRKEATPITPEQLAACGTEHGHQAALFCWAAIAVEVMPELRWLFAIPNGGMRDNITAGKLKAEGVKGGVPDTCLPIRRGQWSGLFIELKRPKSEGKTKGRKQFNQSEWIKHLWSEGFGAMVCFGWIEARDAITAYLATGKK